MDATRVKGYILGVVGAASYGMNPLFALPLMRDGMSTAAVLFYRYLLAIPMILLIMWREGKSLKVSGRQLCLLAVFGSLMGMSSITLFESYKYMDAGIASTLLFVYPLMVAVIMALFFKEKVSVLTVVALILALAGIAMLYKGEGGTTLSALGTMFVMISSLTYAIYIVGIKNSQLSKVATLTVTFYVLLFGLLIFGIYMAIFGGWAVPRGWMQWGSAFGLALFPTAVSFLCTTMAIVYIGSTPTAILGALEPVTAVVIGIAVFGEILTGQDIIGLFLILTGVTMVVVGPDIIKFLSDRFSSPHRH